MFLGPSKIKNSTLRSKDLVDEYGYREVLLWSKQIDTGKRYRKRLSEIVLETNRLSCVFEVCGWARG